MHPDELALLRAIAASPADDLPRLVFADWLDDHGFAVRAEFIRIQCEIARGSADADRLQRLKQREDELIGTETEHILGPAAACLATEQAVMDFRRGFLGRAYIGGGDLASKGATLLDLLPIPEVVLRLHGRGSRLTGVPHLGCVTTLRIWLLTGNMVWMANEIHTAEFRRCSTWARLRTMEIQRSGLTDNGCQNLFCDRAFPALVDLNLSGNHLTDAGVIGLLNEGFPQRLVRLDLSNNREITDQSAFELADRVGRGCPLQSLGLEGTNITAAGRAALVARFGDRVRL